MASNEHKNLSNANLHDPKDFSTAASSTVCSKDSGGNLVWATQSTYRISETKIQGYGTGLSGGSTGYYLFRDDITDNDSPFNFNQDYLTGVATDVEFTTTQLMRTASDVMAEDGAMIKIYGWATGNSTPTITIAIMKCTMIDNDSGGITPVLLDEFEITAAGNNPPRVFERNTVDFTLADVSAGDIIVPMVKSSLASTTIYFNLTIEFQLNGI